MIHAVGEPEQYGTGDQPWVAQMQAEHDQRQPAQGDAHQQDFAGADMIGKIADRRLRQAGRDGEDGESEAKLNVTDAELFFQEGEQHRQHEQMEMTDPMRRRNRGQRPQLFVGLCLLRCGQDVGHVRFALRLQAKLSALSVICP